MSFQVITPATPVGAGRWLTSPERLADDLGLETVNKDRVAYENLIKSVSQAIENFCGRIFAQQVYRELLPPQHGPHLTLRQGPIVAAAVLSDGEPLTGWRIEDADASILYHAYGWHPGRYLGVPWGVAPFEWQIDYTGGFILPLQTTPPLPTGPTLPADLEQACVEGVKVWREERLPSQRITSRHFVDQTISYSVQAGKYGLPKLSQELLMASGWVRMVLR